MPAARVPRSAPGAASTPINAWRSSRRFFATPPTTTAATTFRSHFEGRERMITMIDEIFDRAYQDGRADLNRGIEQLLGSIAGKLDNSLKVFHDLQWSAPWGDKARASKDVGCA